MKIERSKTQTIKLYRDEYVGMIPLGDFKTLNKAVNAARKEKKKWRHEKNFYVIQKTELTIKL